MNAEELKVHIRNTAYFISQRPSSIILTPVSRERIKGGGYKETVHTPRASQTFRIVELGIIGDDQHIQQSSGEVRREPSWLIGMPDAAVEIDDFWTDGNRRWRVSEVIRDNGYETRAVVEEVGR